MATQRDFTGFASDLALNCESENNIRSLTLGRSETFHRICRTTSGASTGVTFSHWTQLGTLTDGQSGGYRVRFRFRLPTVAPNVARSLWFTIGGASSYQTCGILIDTDRTLKCWTNIANGGPYTTGSASAAVPLGYADGEGWVTVDLLCTIVANGTSDSMTVDADITFADGTTESITHTTGATNLSTPNLSNQGLFTVPSSSGFTTNWIGCVDFSEWIQNGATNADWPPASLPPADTRISKVVITAQGSNNGIAYSSGAEARSLRKLFSLATITSDTRLTTTTTGQQSDFTHSGVARLNAAQTYGFRLLQSTSGGGSGLGQFMVGGSNVAGQGNNGSAPKYLDFTQRGQSTFDALQLGVQSVVSSGTWVCNKIQIEVIHDGDGYSDENYAPGGGYQSEWFSWTGNGSGPRTLSGASFRPQMALIFTLDQTQAVKVVSCITGDMVMGATGSWETDAFYGFTADGLVVHGSLNTNTYVYRALLLRDDGQAIYDVSGPTPVVTGYEHYLTFGTVGNTPGFAQDFGERMAMAPEVLMVHPANAAASAVTAFKTRDMGTGLNASLTTAATPESGTRLASFDANGFTWGSSLGSLVSATIPGFWWAWSDAAALYDLVRSREIATSSISISTYTTSHPYQITFEEDADVTRPVIGTVSHGLQATGSPTTITLSSHAVDSGSNRLLLVIVSTYGLSGTRSCTYDGAAMTKIFDVNHAFRRACVFITEAPAVGSADVVWSSTSSVSSVKIAALSIRDCGGVRWVNSAEALTIDLATRLKDIVVAMHASDPLDSGSSYTSPGGWTELFNDGSVSGAGVCAWTNGLADAEVSGTFGLTGSSDVENVIGVILMPAGLPAWDPKLVIVKANGTSAPIAGVRSDDPTQYSGLLSATYASGAINQSNEIVSFADDRVGVERRGSGADLIRQDEAWYLALGAGSIIALSPPTSVDDAYSTPYQTTLTVPVGTGVLANDNSNGGGAMTALLVVDAGVGTLSLASDGSFVYEPPAGYQGTTTFTYRAVNSGGNGTIATVTITISAPTSTTIPVIVEMCFGGSYRNWVKTHASVLAHYFLSDVNSPTAQDEVATGDAGTYTGSPVNGRGILPEYGLSTHFDGATQYVTLDWDGFGLGTDEAFSIACLVRVSGLGAIQCLVSGTSNGLWLGLDATNHFSFGKNGGTKVTSAATVAADETYLVIGTYDGTNARLYVGRIDDASGISLVAGPTAVSIGPNGGADVYIARNNSEEFEGDIQGVALFSAALSLDDVEEVYETTVWTDVSDDVRASVPVVTDRGIHTDKPSTRLAPTGTATFALNNAHDNTGGSLGYYSPDHADVRPGFGRGIPVRIWLDDAMQFIGVIRDIKPVTGRWKDRLSYIFCTDWMDEAARFKLKGIPTQENVTADEVFDLILNEMENKPHEINIAVGSDEYVIALDNSKDEDATAHKEFGNLSLSELGFTYVTGDGTLTFENRSSRLNGTTAFTLDNSMIEAEAEHSTDQLVNSVKVTVHPRRIDAAATTELYTTDNRIRVDNGANPEMFLQFRDPAQEAARVGGLDVVTPVATTDYTFNSAEDGSGADLTGNANISISFEIGSNGVYVTILNNYGQPVYLDIRVRGKGVYDYAPVTLLATDDESINRIGTQEESLDMPYQSSAPVGDSAAQFILNTFADLATRLRTMAFEPRTSQALLSAAIDGEIGTRVAILEDVAAIDGSFYIHGVSHMWMSDRKVVTRWWLVPADTSEYWILGTSELGINTRLSY